MTVLQDDMNLPMSPSIEVGSDGVVHAFWYQEAYDDCLVFTGDAAYYKTRQGGVWTDRSEILAGYKGEWTRHTLDRFGQPALVWRDRWIWPADIAAAIFEPGAGVRDDPPGIVSSIAAAPNPFKSSTLLLPGRPGVVELAIYDAAGRIIRRLTGSSAGADRHSGIVWDGRDEAGKAVPAGAYWAKVSGSSGRDAVSIVRLE